MQKSKIEWTDYVWNPVTGCLHNCQYCYARKMANRLRGRYGYPADEPTPEQVLFCLFSSSSPISYFKNLSYFLRNDALDFHIKHISDLQINCLSFIFRDDTPIFFIDYF
jgi:hypothetical protein